MPMDLKLIQGLNIKRSCPRISYFLFADDTLLFGTATQEEARNIKWTLQMYEKASRQEISYAKSSIKFSRNTMELTKRTIRGITGMQETKDGDKYLGLPSLWGRSKKRQPYPSLWTKCWPKLRDGNKISYPRQGKRL